MYCFGESTSKDHSYLKSHLAVLLSVDLHSLLSFSSCFHIQKKSDDVNFRVAHAMIMW